MARLKMQMMKISNKNFDSASGLLRYIAIREGAEKMPLMHDNRAQTSMQKKLIEKITETDSKIKEYKEYIEYLQKGCRLNAERLISAYILNNPESLKNKELNVFSDFVYSGKRKAYHGLFSLDDDISLNDALKEISEHRGNVWSYVLSLERKDAERLGYVKAENWINLMRSNIFDIAELNEIKATNLKWYAAFHDNAANPHIHLMLYSLDPGEGKMTDENKFRMHLLLNKDIFRMSQYMSFSGNEDLRHEMHEDFLEKMNNIKAEDFTPSKELNETMHILQNILKGFEGKKKYTLRNEKIREYTDRIINEMLKNEELALIYMMLLKIENTGHSMYYCDEEKYISPRYNNELTPIKDELIKSLDKSDDDMDKIYTHLIYSFLSFVSELYEKKMQDMDMKMDKKEIIKNEYKLKAHNLKHSGLGMKI